ncbi:MAG TPA: SRPBCC domain-containing protein [Rhizomicrobium sp.]|jgi:uncharacterized protein YndB with AHSA1/START domain|nr:SRPBCC domain-containing protein [Rhizomicrobium sp.]
MTTQDGPARREVLAGTVLALGGMMSGARAETAPDGDTPATHGRTSLHQDIDFDVVPHRIYDALLDDKQFAAFTGLPAKIDRAVGGALWMFGGRITGRNVELVPDQRIVQAWRDGSWDPGVYSLVKFELRPRPGGATVVLDHIGFAEGNFWHLDPGWHLRYWNPLKKYLAQSR